MTAESALELVAELESLIELGGREGAARDRARQTATSDLTGVKDVESMTLVLC